MLLLLGQIPAQRFDLRAQGGQPGTLGALLLALLKFGTQGGLWIPRFQVLPLLLQRRQLLAGAIDALARQAGGGQRGAMGGLLCLQFTGQRDGLVGQFADFALFTSVISNIFPPEWQAFTPLSTGCVLKQITLGLGGQVSGLPLA